METLALTQRDRMLRRGLGVGLKRDRAGGRSLQDSLQSTQSMSRPPALVQRCVRQTERNILGHLPACDRDIVKRKLRQAWQETRHDEVCV